MTDKFRTVSLVGVYEGVEIGEPSDPIVVRIAMPYGLAGTLVTEAAALRGPDDSPPFALLVLGDGRERSTTEEFEAAALGSVSTLVALFTAEQVRRPLMGYLATILSDLAEQAKARAEAPDRRLQ